MRCILIWALCLVSCSGRRVQLGSVDRSNWSPQALRQYLNARAGSQNPRERQRVWRGRGTLTNTLTGERIADVDFLEKCERFQGGSKDSDGYKSKRVLAYHDKGKLLSKPVPYSHDISHSVEDGHLLLQAKGPDEKVVASGWGVGHGLRRVGAGRAFHFSVRPTKGDRIVAKPEAQMESKTKLPTLKAKPKNTGVLREEYSLEEPPLSRLLGGRGRVLKYKRTGRCPSCCGSGVCTLEVTSFSSPTGKRASRNWWSSLLGHRASDIEDGDLLPDAVLDDEE